MRNELSLWRRHLKSCPLQRRNETKCKCPIWCDGYRNKRIRQSMGTTNWERAEGLRDRIVEPGVAPSVGLSVEPLLKALEESEPFANFCPDALEEYA